jgi:L1 cell adhesion molecule like protein
MAHKIKRGARGAVEAEIAKALEVLEQEDVTADQLKKAHLGVKRAMQKAMASAR